jgi:hypothetical protein
LGSQAAGINYETARLDRQLNAVKIAEEIELDGLFDEGAWAEAPTAGDFIQNEPLEGVPASEQTTVRVLYDDENIYFGVYAKDAEAGRIIINELRKDFNRTSGDFVEIVLDTFHDERNGYHFATNPAGAKWDAQMINEGRETNANWDGVWSVSTRIVDDGWTAELRFLSRHSSSPRPQFKPGESISSAAFGGKMKTVIGRRSLHFGQKRFQPQALWKRSLGCWTFLLRL